MDAPIVADTLFAGFMLVAALAVFALGPGRLVNQALAATLTSRGLETFVNASSGFPIESELVVALGSLTRFLSLLTTGSIALFATAYFYPAYRRAGAVMFWLSVGLGAALVISAPSPNVARILAPLPFIAETALVALLVHSLLREPNRRRTTDWLLALGFIPLAIIDGLLPAMFAVDVGLTWADMGDISPALQFSILATTAAGLGAMLAAFWLVARMHTVPALHGRRRAIMLVIAVALLATTIPFLPALSTYGVAGRVFLAAIVKMLLPIVAAYGLVRHRLFIQGDVRPLFNALGFIAVIAAVFFIVSGALAPVLGQRGVADVLGASASLGLLLGYTPAKRLVNRLSTSLIPGTPAPRDTLSERIQAYEEHLELAWMDGVCGVKERMILTRIRTYLGLEGEQVQALEDAVYARYKMPSPTLG